MNTEFQLKNTFLFRNFAKKIVEKCYKQKLPGRFSLLFQMTSNVIRKYIDQAREKLPTDKVTMILRR